MFRSIRKKRNEISTDEAKELLRSSRRGILAVNGDDGYYNDGQLICGRME